MDEITEAIAKREITTEMVDKWLASESWMGDAYLALYCLRGMTSARRDAMRPHEALKEILDDPTVLSLPAADIEPPLWSDHADGSR